jgi:hypothetical protein
MQKKEQYDNDYLDKFAKYVLPSITKHQQESLLKDVQIERNFHNNDNIEKIMKTIEQNIPESDQQIEIPFEFLFTLIRMSIGYACPRQTISSSMLPQDIITYYYKYLSDEQKQIIIDDLNRYLDFLEDEVYANDIAEQKITVEDARTFGDKYIDDKTWKKFMAALDDSKHITVVVENPETKEQSKVEAFVTNVYHSFVNEKEYKNDWIRTERYYPLREYLESPSKEIYIPTEYIIKSIK